MYKVEVNVPAAITNLGPGLDTLGLALNLHVQIEMSLRTDGDLKITVAGEGADDIPANFRNPVLRAATRLFQRLEVAPVGLNIDIHNRIPLDVGLDAEAAMLIGGLVAANNMTDTVLPRDVLLELALELGLRYVDALTTLRGGLNLCVADDFGKMMHKSLEPPPLQMVVMVPPVEDYAAKTKDALPERANLSDAVFNMGRMVFLMDALVTGDYDLLAHTMQDKLYQHAYTQHIPGYDAAVTAAKANGAAAISLASGGPTLLAFAPYNHALIADAMKDAFTEAGLASPRHWTLGIDAQGVTVSVLS